MSEPFIGEIILFAGDFAPQGWARCEGQLLQISQNTALFSIVGTTYGGDGRTTFGLPDLRGRAAVHPGTGPGLPQIRLGQRGGEEDTTLTSEQLPNHGHAVVAAPSLLKATTQEGALPLPSPTDRPARAKLPQGIDVNLYSSAAPDTTLGGLEVKGAPSGTDPAGGSGSHNNMQPFLTLNYIIALQGTFPSRN